MKNQKKYRVWGGQGCVCGGGGVGGSGGSGWGGGEVRVDVNEECY